MIDSVPCKKCRTQILPEVARKFDGLCKVCAKSVIKLHSINELKSFLYTFMCILMITFVLLWMLVKNLWRLSLFPFNRFALYTAIRKTGLDRKESWSYLFGVATGYATSAPIFDGFAQWHLYKDGMNDGGRLRRGEITFKDIPTIFKLPDPNF